MEKLFKDEEYDIIQEPKPVIVLGRTFVNEDERRTYFRDELRKKLPELNMTVIFFYNQQFAILQH